MKKRIRRSPRGGYALVTVVLFLIIVSTILGGMGAFVASHNQIQTVDSRYAAALDLAEAGINKEYNKLSLDTATADQSPGATYDLGSGSYTVYCTNRDGTTPWVPSQYLYVIATGTVAGVTRTVKAECKGNPPDGRYAIYTLNNISIWKGASALINGDVGSNGKYQYSADPTINGSIFFNGPDAGWSNGDPG